MIQVFSIESLFTCYIYIYIYVALSHWPSLLKYEDLILNIQMEQELHHLSSVLIIANSDQFIIWISINNKHFEHEKFYVI